MKLWRGKNLTPKVLALGTKGTSVLELWKVLSPYNEDTYRCRKTPAQTLWGDRGDQNKDLFSRNYIWRVLVVLWTVKLGVFEVGNQATPLKYSWGGEKKVVFCPNSEQMFKHTATDLNTQLTMMKQRMTCTLKNATLLPDGCCCLNNTGNKNASESTGDVEIRALVWPHTKKSIGMRSGDLGGQAIGPHCAIQRSL